MSRGIHRVTPYSKAGRRMVSVGMEVDTTHIPKDVLEWNAEVERRKAERKARTKAAQVLADQFGSGTATGRGSSKA